MKTLKKTLVFIFLYQLLGLINCLGQELTLEQCIDYALKNNFDIKQQELKAQSNQNILKQSKMALLPNLSGSFSHGNSFGRNIDPFSNAFVERNIAYNGYGLNSNVTIFKGFQLKNQIRQNQLNLSVEETIIENQKNNLTFNVILAFMQVLLNQELLKIAQEQEKSIKTQLDRIKNLVQEGLLSKTTIIDLDAQLANAEFDIVSSKTNFDLSRLALAQNLNWQEEKPLEVSVKEVKEPTELLTQNELVQLIQQITTQQPVVRAAELRIESAKLGIEIAKSDLYPNISLGVGLGSAYSSVAPKRFVADGTGEKITTAVSNFQFIDVNGRQYPLTTITSSPNGTYQNFGYLDQLNFNFNKYIRLNVAIPIFSNWEFKSKTANAILNKKSAEFDLQKAKTQLKQEIEQLYYNLMASYEKYKSAKRQLDAQKIAFESATARFEEGVIHSIELNNFRLNLEKAKSSLVQSKYEYSFRKKILDFYK